MVYRQQRRRKSGIKINPRLFYILAVITAAVLIVVLLLLETPKTKMAESGELAFSEAFTSVIIRDEKVYETENYEKSVFIAAEGERIKKGDSVAEVYEWGYNDSVINELLDLQKKIKNYQEGTLLKDITNVELKDYNDKIYDESVKIQETISGEKEEDIITLERNLKKLMTDRKERLKTAVKADETLEQLYTQENDLLTKINKWKKAIEADYNGIVSFYFDGCEQFMNIQNISKLTKNNIDSILKGEASKLIIGEKAARPLFRIVNADKWYLMLYTSRKVNEFKYNVRFKFTFEDIKDKTFSGKLAEERMDERWTIYTFLMTDDVLPLLRSRRMDVKIENTFSGLKVPEKAVKEKDGAYGVYVKDGNYKKFEPVNVLIIKGGVALVTPMGENSLLKNNSLVEY